MALLQQKIVLCNELTGHPDILERSGISDKQIEEILHEAAALCATAKGIV
jgi:hypothetical protein